MRTYLYRIATNVCLTALGQRARRAMPSDLTAPDQEWLQPIPDAVLFTWSDPADVVQADVGIRLAFIAALQHLPPIRRPALILRDVLSWRTAQVAEALDTTPAAVNSALLRARAQIAQVAPVIESVVEPAEPQRRAMLDRYVAAFANADIASLVRLLRADIALEMPPEPQWLRGRDAVGKFFADHVLSAPREFRMLASMANRQPAFVACQRTQDGTYQPHAIHVLTLDQSGVAHIAVFREPTVWALFPREAARGLPVASHAEEGPRRS